jgi:ADP-heptose:LPS heptosyltransferase
MVLSPIQKKWLIIRNGAVGDTLLLSPVVLAIRDRYPNALIEVMGNLERVELLAGDGMADQATTFDQPGMETLFVDDGELSASLKQYFSGFDVIVYYGQNGLERIAPKLRINPDQVVITHPALPDGDDVHITQHYLQAVKSLIDPHKTFLPKIALRDDEIAWGKSWLQQQADRLDDSYVLGIHCGAGSKTKQAPFDLFHQKIEDIKSQKPLILIPKGPADEDVVNSFVDSLTRDIPYIIVDGLRLRELAAVLSHCNEFIGNDSGVTHIAAALGIPTTAVFVSGKPEVWKPLGECVTIINCRMDRACETQIHLSKWRSSCE